MRDNTKTTREPPSQEKWPCSQDLTALEARKQKKTITRSESESESGRTRKAHAGCTGAREVFWTFFSV